MAFGGDRGSAARARMVDEQIVARGISDPAVLAAMRRIPRDLFVPEEARDQAYDDAPVAIGRGQTISQPYIVALMSELAGVGAASRVLEVGTGCGYQSAVLAACAAHVWTVELEADLSARAGRTLAALGIDNVSLRVGDGADGWPEEAPFDAVVVTAAPARTPPALLDQLGLGGRLVIPIGVSTQDLFVFTRSAAGIERRSVIPVRFVPLR